MARKNIIIFDNGGKTSDRYTGIITKTGDVVGFNENPFHPSFGFGQFCGNVTDRMNITYGYEWRNHFNEKQTIRRELRNYLNEARQEPEWLGKAISVEELSEEAQKYLLQVLSE